MEYYVGNDTNFSLETNYTYEEGPFSMDGISKFEWFWPIFWTIASITTIDNSVVILLVTFKKKLHTKTNWFILSLSCADFIVGGVAAPIDYLVYKTQPEDELSHVLMILINMFFDISAVNLCLVAFDRYLAVVYPLKYVTFLTTNRVRGLIILAWIVPALLSAAQLVILFTINTYISQDISSQILVVLFQLLPMLFLIVTFIHIACIVRKHLKRINRENQQIQFNTAAGPPLRQSSRYRSILPLMAIINGTFVLCYGISVYDFFCQQISLTIPFQFIAINRILIIFNSLVNPIVYGILKSDFRRELRRLVCLECVNIRKSQSVSIVLTNVNSLRSEARERGESEV